MDLELQSHVWNWQIDCSGEIKISKCNEYRQQCKRINPNRESSEYTKDIFNISSQNKPNSKYNIWVVLD